ERTAASLWQAARVDTAPDLRFAIALFGATAGSGDSNHVCSPWSVASSLAALAPGTTADARDEIAAAVGPPDRLRHEAALVAESGGRRASPPVARGSASRGGRHPEQWCRP